MINNVFYKPQKKNLEESNMVNTGPGNGPPSYPVVRKFPVQKGTNAIGEVRWCTT
jgi:hypothetical protein